MSLCQHTIKAILVLLYLLAPSSYAESWQCTQDDLVREVIVEHPIEKPALCKVIYSKPTEDDKSQLLWTATNNDVYCKEKANQFVNKLISWEWECSTMLPNYGRMLEKYTQASKNKSSPFSENELAIMESSTRKLAVKIPNPGIRVGKSAPSFVLNNAFGKPVSLKEQLKKGPVVLVFYRGAWCPYCNMHLHALQNSLSAINQYGAQLIAITPQRPDKSVEQIKEKDLSFEVLSDLDSRVMKAYNLHYELPGDLVEVYKKHGLDIEAYNGAGRAILPVPGTFVIDKAGIVRAMHADVDYKQRMEPSVIIDALKAIQ